MAAAWVVASWSWQRDRHGAARAGAATLGALAVTPVWFCACLAVVSEPAASTVVPMAGDRIDEWIFGALLAVAVPIVLWRGGAALAWSSWPRMVTAGRRWHRRASACGLGLAALVLAFAAARAARHPPADRPLEAAERVATFAPLGPSRHDSKPVRRTVGVYTHRPDGARPPRGARVARAVRTGRAVGLLIPRVPDFVAAAPRILLEQNPNAAQVFAEVRRRGGSERLSELLAQVVTMRVWHSLQPSPDPWLEALRTLGEPERAVPIRALRLALATPNSGEGPVARALGVFDASDASIVDDLAARLAEVDAAARAQKPTGSVVSPDFLCEALRRLARFRPERAAALACDRLARSPYDAEAREVVRGAKVQCPAGGTPN